MGLLNQTQQQYYSNNNFGGYQFTSINDIIDNFMATYVGEGKILSKTNRADVSFHAHRALQELSFDTFKSCKMLEMEILPNLTMLLPQDYVNYVKLSWSDDSGIEHVILPAIKTSNPIKVDQDPDDLETYNYTSESQLKTSLNSPDDITSSTTWENYKSASPSENQKDDYNYDDDNFSLNIGQRYGLDPRHAQVNGSFYIDEAEGNIHFSSNISGKTVILKYISDGLSQQYGHDLKVNVHKFAEEAMYKQILYAVLSGSALPIHQQLVPRFKKEAFAAKRNAKLRLSNIKIEEIAQVMRGKSKILKH